MSRALGRMAIPEVPRSGVARRSLQWRVLLLVGVGMAGILAAFSVSSLLAVNESTDRILDERQNLAAATAGYVDYVVRQSLKSLDEVALAPGFDLEDANPAPEEQALRLAYFGSIFSGGVYLADAEGTVVSIEPLSPANVGASIGDRPHVKAALAEGRPFVSGYTIAVTYQGPVVSLVVPVRNGSGQIVGLVGGDISLGDTRLAEIIRPSAISESGYTQIVDAGGTILASTRPTQVLQKSDHEGQVSGLIEKRRTASGTCHSCHAAPGTTGGTTREAEVMSFAPVKSAPWGVLIRQPESEALALSGQLTQRAIWFGVPAFALALLFAWATVRSVVRPVAALTAAAEKLASGDLSQPVAAMGKDEVGGLARAFETMRVRLKDALETIESWASELEGRVRDRTRELEESRDHLRAVADENAALYEELKHREAARTELLSKVIGAQEEERRRIARELHDETSQALTVLAMGMETAAQAPPTEAGKFQEKLAVLKDLAVKTLDGVHRLIYDLRPSVLDDLGLVPGLRWYAESRLQPQGVRVSLMVEGDERRLPVETETALFRIAQEAIANVARHAHAANVFIGVSFESDSVALEVEDDGQGFDMTATGEAQDGRRGWGLLGMRERASLVGGALDMNSEPGGGTRLRVAIPLPGGQ